MQTLIILVILLFQTVSRAEIVQPNSQPIDMSKLPKFPTININEGIDNQISIENEVDLISTSGKNDLFLSTNQGKQLTRIFKPGNNNSLTRESINNINTKKNDNYQKTTRTRVMAVTSKTQSNKNDFDGSDRSYFMIAEEAKSKTIK